MTGETPVARLASLFGTMAILAWFVFLGPIGALIMFGVAHSMIHENPEMTTFLIGLASLPVSLTVLWGTVSVILLTDRTGSEASSSGVSKVKINA